jgi:hypothetical protein
VPNPTIFTSIGDLSLQQIQGGAAGSATATGSGAGTATVNAPVGRVTTTSLTTAAGGTATLTIDDSLVSVGDIVFASVRDGSATTGTPVVATAAVTAAGVITVLLQNIHASAALNGTLVVSFMWVPFL